MKSLFPSFLIFVVSVVFFSFSSSQKGIIAKNYPNLVGEYELIVIYSDNVVEASEVPGKITLTITKGDKMTIYNNGKKINKYEFNDRRSPLPMGTEDYVMFNQKNENSALFFKGDTVIQILYPNLYSENYFKKVK